jgi:hypothetical protein
MTSGKKHSQCHLRTRQSRCLTLRTPIKERIVAFRAVPETMHLQSERSLWYTSDQVLPHRARVRTMRRCFVVFFYIHASSCIGPTIPMLWFLCLTHSYQEMFNCAHFLMRTLSHNLQEAANQQILLRYSVLANSYRLFAAKSVIGLFAIINYSMECSVH